MMWIILFFLILVGMKICGTNAFKPINTYTPYRSSQFLLSMNTNTLTDNQLEILKLKNQLYELSARTNRGEITSNEGLQDIISDVLGELESLNPSFDMSDDNDDDNDDDDDNDGSDGGSGNNKYSINGDWELLYTDTQLFAGSPFFLSLREFFGSDRYETR